MAETQWLVTGRYPFLVDAEDAVEAVEYACDKGGWEWDATEVTTPTAATDPAVPPAPGTLYLTPDGTGYRLRGYHIDWMAEPFTGIEDQPSYTVLLPNGAASTAEHLPADATLIWAPPTK